MNEGRLIVAGCTSIIAGLIGLHCGLSPLTAGILISGGIAFILLWSCLWLRLHLTRRRLDAEIDARHRESVQDYRLCRYIPSKN